MEARWMIYSKRADFNQISEQFHIDPVIARVIRNREIIGEEAISEYLYPSLSCLYSPWLLKDMEKAVGIILDKILVSHKIRIISDYDVDGVMANYILYKGLLRAGADVDYYIPDRVVDGYGINEAMIDMAYDAGVNTIITCDNGVAAIEAIRHAKELNMTVIVTDHHEVLFEEKEGEKSYLYPEADAIVDPKQADCTYPLPDICGATVAYKLIEGIYEKKGIDKQELYPFIEYAAFATVSDVMPLLDENRAIVKLGLEMLNNTDNEGLKALIAVNQLQDKVIDSYHIGFTLGPCINATGRLDTAELSLLLLLADNKADAMDMANRLLELNTQRKNMTNDYVEKAYELIEANNMQQDKVIVVYLEGCHESIAGIIAARVRERYYRPALILCDAGDNILKGSGRSIDEYNMYDGLRACQDCLLKFGGHKMAAGFSIVKEDLDGLRKRLNDTCVIAVEDMKETMMIDVPMPVDYLSFDLVEQLDCLRPFGNANSKPIFAQTSLHVKKARILGQRGNVLKLSLESVSGTEITGMYFEVDEFVNNIKAWFGEYEYTQMINGWMNNVWLDIAYYPVINEFNGSRSLEINILRYRKHEEE